jgi:hypothetical protein
LSSYDLAFLYSLQYTVRQNPLVIERLTLAMLRFLSVFGSVLLSLWRRGKRTLQYAVLWPLCLMLKIGVHQLSYKRLSRLLVWASPTPPRATNPQALTRARTYGHAVNRAAKRAPFHVTCLQRSLLLWWLLRWRGVHSTVRFGVRIEGQQMHAHAWVTHADAVINDTPQVASRFGVYPESLTPDQVIRWVG